VIVYKFGGALARTRRGIEALARITHEAYTAEVRRGRRKRQSAEQDGLVVVVSAIGHTTRHLARAAELAEEGKLIDAEALVDKVVSQHEQLATSLLLDDMSEAFETIGNSARSLLEGVAITRELSARTRDGLLAHGESFALSLLEEVLEAYELPVHPVDAREIIVTNENFGHAAPNIAAVASQVHRLVLPRLKRGDIVLTQGFVGATPDGVTTTMGSESSDLTATLLAGALGAREVVIWKMLPGIYSADPELVPNAKLVRSLSFDEAEEIGRRGARVLYSTFAHPLAGTSAKTILRIATPFAKNSRHTVLSRTTDEPIRKQRALNVTLEDKLVAVSLTRRPKASSLPRQRESFSPRDIALASWQTADESVYVISREDRRTFQRMMDRDRFVMKEGPGVTAISVVIRKLRIQAIDPSFIATIARSLRTFNVHAILPIEQSLMIFVAESDGVNALKKLHRDLFEV
jgi:aspartate kinase